jgi:hypothetical protein
MAEAAAQTQLIKQSMALRAKYEVCDEKYYPTHRVVPYTENRGGNVINNNICKELTRQLVEDGVDPIEPNMNGVCGGNGTSLSKCLCQEHWRCRR